MQEVIWKYELKLEDTQAITIPFDPHMLSVGDQDGKLCLWAKVDPNAEKIKMNIHIYGTGHPFNSGSDKFFIGTVIQGEFVWHVFCGGMTK